MASPEATNNQPPEEGMPTLGASVVNSIRPYAESYGMAVEEVAIALMGMGMTILDAVEQGYRIDLHKGRRIKTLDLPGSAVDNPQNRIFALAERNAR